MGSSEIQLKHLSNMSLTVKHRLAAMNMAQTDFKAMFTLNSYYLKPYYSVMIFCFCSGVIFLHSLFTFEFVIESNLFLVLTDE